MVSLGPLRALREMVFIFLYLVARPSPGDGQIGPSSRFGIRLPGPGRCQLPYRPDPVWFPGGRRCSSRFAGFFPGSPDRNRYFPQRPSRQIPPFPIAPSDPIRPGCCGRRNFPRSFRGCGIEPLHLEFGKTSRAATLLSFWFDSSTK